MLQIVILTICQQFPASNGFHYQVLDDNCLTYDSLTPGTRVAFEKCDPADAKQSSWFLIDIPIPEGAESAVMGCVSEDICDGIDSEGYESLWVKNATDSSQQWVIMMGNNNQYTNVEAGPNLCSTIIVSDDPENVPNRVKLTKCDPSNPLQKFTAT